MSSKHDWYASFPDRVWDETEHGWTSRAATQADWNRRREFAREMAKPREERQLEDVL